MPPAPSPVSGGGTRAAPLGWRRPFFRTSGRHPTAARAGGAFARGFTLLELLVVVSIMALATAGAALALRDSDQTQLEREAERLAALLESARAQSRATGLPVRWQALPNGFRFDGLPASSTLPTQWLDPATGVRGPGTLVLGPEPLIGPQQVTLTRSTQPDRALRVATDGLRPFAVQAQ